MLMSEETFTYHGADAGPHNGDDNLEIRALEMERWLPQTTQAMRKLRVPGRGDPERYARLLQVLVEKGELAAADVVGLGLSRNLSRVAETLRKYLKAAHEARKVPDRAKVRLEGGRIKFELLPASKALVLLELHPGRYHEVRYTPRLVARLKEYFEEEQARGREPKFRLVTAGHLLSGDYQVFLMLEGTEYESLVYEFVVRVLSKVNSDMRKDGICFKHNIIPILPAGEFDMEYIQWYRADSAVNR
jgi:hypothetical protein